MSSLSIAVASGMCVALGAFLIVLGTVRRHVHLGDALALLDGQLSVSEGPGASESARGLEGLAAWLQRRVRLPVSERQRQLLLLQERTLGDFFAEKFVLSVAGLLLPGVWMTIQFLIAKQTSPMPLAFSLVGAVLGYFAADWRLAADAKLRRRATTESVHTFFDLVALERLANASAGQAVASAASISEAPLFRRIARGLERARLEQAAPWPELTRIAREWDQPELADFADVMRLEEQGAALADVLQARVRELRDAHLSTLKSDAQAATEGLTIWMTLPALLLGLAFLVPPLLTLASG